MDETRKPSDMPTAPPDDPDVLREEDVTDADALDERERDPLPSDRATEG